MRRYIRHPSDIPITITQAKSWHLADENLLNISYGGLSFLSQVAYPKGSGLKITISAVSPTYETNAKVCWCKAQGDSFEVGVELLSENDAYNVRMVEQVCHITQYQRRVYLKEGRDISGAVAASEWIGRFAHEFPELEVSND